MKFCHQDISKNIYSYELYTQSANNSQGHNFYKLKYISLEEVKIVPFQQ